MDILELCKFLVKAKINTYTSGREGTILTDGSKELTFEEGEFVYRDKYHGFNPFIGGEVVFCKGKCIWGMNYYGYIIPSEGISQKEVYAFLREALKKVGKEKPFRGPKKYEENSFQYVNSVEGNLGMFNGIEKILYKGKEVYRLLYHGGFTKGEI